MEEDNNENLSVPKFIWLVSFSILKGVVFGLGIMCGLFLLSSYISEKTNFHYEEMLSLKMKMGIVMSVSSAVKMVDFKTQKAREKFTRKYDTTAAWQLDTEHDAYPDLNQKHYDIIDNTIDFVKKKIAQQKNWDTLSDAKRANLVFSTIHGFLLKYHRNTNNAGEILLSRGFDKENIDCDLGSVVYLAVGEALNLPIVVILVPTTNDTGKAHIFVCWYHEDGSHTNWETVQGDIKKTIMTDDDYRKWLGSKDLLITFIPMDGQGYRENWKKQLHYAYTARDWESTIKANLYY